MNGAPTLLDAARAAEVLLDADARGLAVAEVVVVEGKHTGGRMLLLGDGSRHGSLGDASLDVAALRIARRLLEHGETTVEHAGDSVLFVLAQRPAERLLIVGAGHIAVPLAALGVRLGFDVTVLDDREEFATPERFPAGARVSRADFAGDPFANATLDARTSVALVTRGHRWDFDCLRLLLERPVQPRYVGMIGSRRRVRAAFTALLRAGVPREKLARIHAPIGIEIGAETPEEIAVSIAAELIAVRRGTDIQAMTSRERVLERLLPERVENDG